MFINAVLSAEGPAGGGRSLWHPPPRVGNHVSLCSNTILFPVEICDDVVGGAGAVVTRDITKPGIYAENPARFLRTPD